MEVSGQLHIPAALPWGKVPQYQMDRRPGGPQSRSERCGEEKDRELPESEPVARHYTDSTIQWL
jgi:hypothetical protein